jgi:ABC-type transport system involved in cytochrome c biogenesis permease subunit
MAFWLIVIAVAVQTIGLVTRIYVSGRPPVTNIYSSAVFVGWAAVLSSLALELKSKFGLGNLLAAFGGMMTLFIAQSFATQGDTITVMQAVLDTQFWLATHVVIISLGYSGTFLAGFLGVIYILTGVLSPRMNKSTRKMLADQIHLVTCVSLLLSFFGTVLGGLWADDSWGRFWGWDPKENGALMIVLWNAVVLHARWGGVVRERGMAMLAIIGNIVVSWSWFAVNELGVGLHQYGATEGTMQNLFIFWGTQLAVCCIGALPFTYWWSYRAEEKLAAVRRGEAIPIAELSKQPARAPAQQAGRKKTPKRKKR